MIVSNLNLNYKLFDHQIIQHADCSSAVPKVTLFYDGGGGFVSWAAGIMRSS